MADPDPKMMFIDPVGPWHWWFAWHPVRTYDQRLIWLRWCRRRCMQKHQHLYGGPDFSWQYHCQGLSGSQSIAENIGSIPIGD